MNKKDKENFELLQYYIERRQSGSVLLDSSIKMIELYLKDFSKVPNEVANYIKGVIQEEALQYWIEDGYWGAILAATGVGKSRIFVLACVIIDKAVQAEQGRRAKIILGVPTQKLRDLNWKEEFEKWGALDVWENCVRRECYASFSKIEGEEYDLMGCDEYHNITELSSTFFTNNKVKRLLALSATEPTNEVKKGILHELNIKVCYEVPLDTAVKLKLVAPYEVVVVEVRLDNTDKYIEAGSKTNRFFQTELAAYDYATKQMEKAMYGNNAQLKMFKAMARMRVIHNLKSKTKAAKKVLSLLPEDARVLTFCSTIAQAEELADRSLVEHLIAITPEQAANDPNIARHTYHSKSGDEYLTKFQNQEIDRLTCVKAINEGMNMPAIDYGVIVQLDSKELSLIQRIGRIIRYREGHVGKIILIICIDTKDEDWMKKAMENLDQSNVRHVRYQNLINGTDHL